MSEDADVDYMMHLQGRVNDLTTENARLLAALAVTRAVIEFYSDRGMIADENAAQALAIADAAISSN